MVTKILSTALLVIAACSTQASDRAPPSNNTELNTTIALLPSGYRLVCASTNLNKTDSIYVITNVYNDSGTLMSAVGGPIAPGESRAFAYSQINTDPHNLRCSFRFKKRYAGSILAALEIVRDSTNEPAIAIPAK